LAEITINFWWLLAILGVIVVAIWLFELAGDHPLMIVFLGVMHVAVFVAIAGKKCHHILGWPEVHFVN
jgi:hypothetical protein